MWSTHIDHLGPTSRLRNALIAPRVMSPRGGRSSSEPIVYEQACAMVMRGNLRRLSEMASRGGVPKQSTWATHRHWGWNFVDALVTLTERGDFNSVVRLEKTAVHAHEKTACRILTACAKFQGEDLDGALAALANPKDAGQIDEAWVRAHRANVAFELGDEVAAASEARAALVLLSETTDDVSATALRAGCASLLYSIAEVGDETRFGSAAVAQDSAVNWWRQQTVSLGLIDDLKDRFLTWSGANRFQTTIGATENTDLHLARWNAALASDWSSWRACSEVAGLQVLASGQPVSAADVASALNVLRVAGHKAAVRSATNQLWREGPLEVLGDAAREVSRSTWTRRATISNLELLAGCADLLSRADAAAAIERVTGLLAVGTEVHQIGHGWTWLWTPVGAALKALLTVADRRSQDVVAHLVAEQYSKSDDMAEVMKPALRSLQVSDVDQDTLVLLLKAGEARSDAYEVDMLEVLAPEYSPAAEKLAVLAAAGSEAASRARLAMLTGDQDDWLSLLDSSRSRVERLMSSARASTYPMLSDVPLLDLAKASYQTHDAAGWKLVGEALQVGLAAADVASTVWFLAWHFADLDDAGRSEIVKAALSLRVSPMYLIGLGRSVDLAGLALSVSASLLNEDVAIDGVLRALQGSLGERADACRALAIFSAAESTGILIGLARDDSAEVRGAAANALVQKVIRGEAPSSLILPSLLAIARDSGCLAPALLAASVSSVSAPEFSEIRSELSLHPSARVRSKLK